MNTTIACLTAAILSVAVFIVFYIGYQKTGTTEIGGETRSLNISGEASVNCESLEFEDDRLYLSGLCSVTILVRNMENRSIVVHGITILYDDKRVDILVNGTVGPNQVNIFKGEFVLPEKVLISDGTRVFMKVIILFEYLGRASKVIAEPVHISI